MREIILRLEDGTEFSTDSDTLLHIRMQTATSVAVSTNALLLMISKHSDTTAVLLRGLEVPLSRQELQIVLASLRKSDDEETLSSDSRSDHPSRSDARKRFREPGQTIK